MRLCVFVGPTLPACQVLKILRADIRPPVALGDVLRAVNAGFDTLVLIDGFFHGEPAVWHKEIFYALSRNCVVVGCSSMGALRAAELVDYGMHGFGDVFNLYASGDLHADDEVAVAHADRESGYSRLSEPLVNIRYGLGLAAEEGLVSDSLAEAIIMDLKALFYPDRHWERVFLAAAHHGATITDVERLRRFIRGRDVDLKRLDAQRTLEWINSGGHLSSRSRSQQFNFEETHSWRLLQMVETPRTAVVRGGSERNVSCVQLGSRAERSS